MTIPNIVIAQDQEEEIVVDFPFAFTQSVVRSSEGDLVVYQENYAPRVANIEIFNEFLDQQVEQGEAELILLDVGNRILEMIQFETTEVFEFDQLRAWDQLLGIRNNQTINLVAFFHEGYPVSEGDVITITWTFFRQP